MLSTMAGDELRFLAAGLLDAALDAGLIAAMQGDAELARRLGGVRDAALALTKEIGLARQEPCVPAGRRA